MSPDLAVRLLAALTGSVDILVTWVMILVSFTGIGAALRAMVRASYRDQDDLLVDFWMGFLCVIAVLQVWNLFLPVDARAWIAVVPVAVWGLLRARPTLIAGQRASHPRGRRWLVATVLLLGLWIADRASGSSGLVDDGLYHVQVVKWLSTYPIVPGLGNLHGRFAFNQSVFLYDALLNVGPWRGAAIHLAGGLLLWLLTMQGVAGVRRLAKDPVPTRSSVFNALLLVPVLDMVLHREPASLTTDLPVTVLVLVSGSWLFRILEDSRAAASTGHGYDFAATAMVLLAIPTIKLSGAVFSLLGLGLLGFAWWRQHPSIDTRTHWRTLRPLALAAGLLIGPWLARGVVLSGYPAYPLAVAGLPVPWRVPAIQARVEADYVASHARLLSLDGLGIGSDWLRDWPGRIWRRKFLWGGSIIPAAATLLAGVVLLRRRVTRRGTDAGGGAGHFLLLASVGALVAWFLTAPAIRFAAGLFWLTAATTITLAAGPTLPTRRQTVPLLAGAALLLAILGVKALEGGWRGPGRFLRSVVEIPEDGRPIAPLPQQPWDTVRTDHGLVLSVPRGGNLLCWDDPLPCTPHPDRSLALRRPEDLSSGFVRKGQWAPVDWPAPGGAYLFLWRCLHQPGVPRSDAHERECLAAATDSSRSTGEARRDRDTWPGP